MARIGRLDIPFWRSGAVAKTSAVDFWPEVFRRKTEYDRLGAVGKVLSIDHVRANPVNNRRKR